MIWYIFMYMLWQNKGREREREGERKIYIYIYLHLRTITTTQWSLQYHLWLSTYNTYLRAKDTHTHTHTIFYIKKIDQNPGLSGKSNIYWNFNQTLLSRSTRVGMIARKSMFTLVFTSKVRKTKKPRSRQPTDWQKGKKGLRFCVFFFVSTWREKNKNKTKTKQNKTLFWVFLLVVCSLSFPLSAAKVSLSFVQQNMQEPQIFALLAQ